MSASTRNIGRGALFARHPARELEIDGASYSLPLHVYACDMHIISGTVALAPLTALLAAEGVEPAPLARLGGPVGVAQLWLNDYHHTSIGPYRELMVSFSVAARPGARPHRARNYLSALGPFADPRCAVLVRWLYLDRPAAIELGRAVWGFPKRAGALSFTASADGRLTHETLDERGERVLRADFTRERGPAAALRAIRAMFRGLGVAPTLRLLGERTHSALAITPRELKQTLAPVRFQGWVDVFPWRGELRLGDQSPAGRALQELEFEPLVVQHMPEVRFVMLEPAPFRPESSRK